MKQGYALMALGAILLLTGLFFDMVTLVVDDTPPIVDPGTVPADGEVYQQLDHLVVYCYDTESGIDSVYVWIESTKYTLSYVGKEPQSPYEIWELDISSSPITASGDYDFNIHVTNKAGLTTVVNGTFTIYTDLQGDWYIGGTKITSSTQTIYYPGTTITFQFIKTAGIEDPKITCYVKNKNTGAVIFTLDYVSSGRWSKTYTFSPGTYNLELIADDGINPIIFSIVDLSVGQQVTPIVQPQTPQWTQWDLKGLFFIGGIALFVIGYWQYKKGGG